MRQSTNGGIVGQGMFLHVMEHLDRFHTMGKIGLEEITNQGSDGKIIDGTQISAHRQERITGEFGLGSSGDDSREPSQRGDTSGFTLGLVESHQDTEIFGLGFLQTESLDKFLNALFGQVPLTFHDELQHIGGFETGGAGEDAEGKSVI